MLRDLLVEGIVEINDDVVLPSSELNEDITWSGNRRRDILDYLVYWTKVDQ